MKTSLTLLILLTFFSRGTSAQDFFYTTLEGHGSAIHTIAYSPDGKMLASGSWDETIRLWDVATGEHKHTLTEHASNVYSLSFSADGRTLASGSNDGKIRLWDAATGLYKVTLEGHGSRIYSIVFSPDGKTLASGSEDSKIRLWDAITGLYKVTLEGHGASVYSLAFSPDGKTLASGSEDSTGRLWDAVTGQHKQTLTGHTNSVTKILFILDGLTLASESSDGTIRLWDAVTGQHKQTLTGYTHSGRSVSISPDGKMLANISRNSNNEIQLWDLVTGQHSQTLTGHTRNVTQVLFSPDGKTLASGSEDSIVRLWDLSTQVNITPSSVTSPAVGEQFVVNVNIVDGQDVRGYQVTVEYNSDTLRYVSHTNGDYLPGDVFIGPIVNTPGIVSLNVTSPSGVGSGGGTLTALTFEVVARKASIFTLSGALSDSNGKRLPFVVKSGIVIEPLWDVNGDGSIDILDLSFVAARFGQNEQAGADVNRDGKVDIKDLILIASGMNAAAAAPSAWHHGIEIVPPIADVQQWLTQAQQLNLTDATSQQGILFLEQLLSALTPKETLLLPNYPNPFNPETWIPYQLVEPADVTFRIYSVDGKLIRTLVVGHQPAGIYQHRSCSAHWDGKNDIGEPVASGIYFYTLTAGDFTVTRKMLIRK